MSDLDLFSYCCTFDSFNPPERLPVDILSLCGALDRLLLLTVAIFLSIILIRLILRIGVLVLNLLIVALQLIFILLLLFSSNIVVINCDRDASGRVLLHLGI